MQAGIHKNNLVTVLKNATPIILHAKAYYLISSVIFLFFRVLGQSRANESLLKIDLRNSLLSQLPKNIPYFLKNKILYQNFKVR